MRLWLTLVCFIGLVKECLLGVLQPEAANSVLPYRNNQGAIGKYTFTFKLSSPVPSNPRITIDFPPIYTKILNNVDACSGSVTVLLRNEVKAISCSIQSNTVIFDLSDSWSFLDAGNIVVELYDVVNPSSVAYKSTGFFQLKTWSGIDIVIDSNAAFESIAFAPAYTTFPSVGIVNDGANIAGYTTNYILSFSTTMTYTKGTWFRLVFPAGFSFGKTPNCYITNIEVSNSDLPCYAEGSTLVMKDLMRDLTPGTYSIKMRNIVNPSTATTLTGSFLFESLKLGVFTVIEQTASVPGVSITPGAVTDVSVVGFPLVQNLYVDYTITFLPSNIVPVGGQIQIQFPPDFVSGIDGTCRIAYGLIAANSNGLKCTTNKINTLYISNFQELVPKYIQVNCFAYNPPVAGPTQNFQVRTYTTTAATQIIDQNPQAGIVVISSIDTPNFMQVDFYKPHVNCSFYQDCPLNFRYFPDPARTLKKSPSTASFSTINLQIPIWWMTMSQGSNSTVPECLFGTVPSAGCMQNQHVYSILTPSTQAYGACELPVTINNMRVSPIPGKFPFRIWSFNDGSKYHKTTGFTDTTKWYQTPIEQDTYVMDIPATGIAVLQTYSSGSESGDPDNLLHMRSNVHPFLFAWSGTISIVVTHLEDSLQDKAAWPVGLGQGMTTSNAIKELGCKLYQSGTPVGYLATWWNSKDLRCVVQTGDLSKNEPTILQATGFDSNIDKGNYYEFFIPDIKFCTTLNRQCKVLYTYTMSEDYYFPYRISGREQVLRRVNPAEIAANILPAQGTTPASWGNTVRSGNVRCDSASFYAQTIFTKTLTTSDYLVFKRSIAHWYEPFLNPNRYSIVINGVNGANWGYPVLMKALGLEYIIYRIQATVAPPATSPFMNNIQYYTFVNTPYKNAVADTSVVMWASNLKHVRGAYKSSAISQLTRAINNIGITTTSDTQPTGIPWTHQNFWTPVTYQGRSCLPIPETGEVVIQFYSGRSPMDFSPASNQYTVTPTVCRVWLPIINPAANQTEVKCVYDSANRRFRISNFKTILPRTTMKITWWADHGTAVGNHQMTLNSFANYGDYSAASVLDFSGDGTLDTVASGTNTVTWTPARQLAVSWKFVGHYEYEWELYQGSRGKFVFEITVGHNMQWETTESQYFMFTFSNTVTLADNLECRYAQQSGSTFGHHYPSVQCSWIAGTPNNQIKMLLHPRLNIAAGTRYQVFIDTRLFDTLDGLVFNRYGVYTINMESYVSNTKQRGGKQRYEVFGPRILHFYVWSSNKIAGLLSHYTYYIDWIDTITIRDSTPTLTSFDNIMLYFDTTSPGGYPMDLAAGFPDQSVIPCTMLLGIPLWTGTNTAICTLYYGYSSAPARIKIEGFRSINTRVIRIDIPKVGNPTATGVVPRTWGKVLSTTVVAGVKSVAVTWEGRYYELNTTWSRNNTKYTYYSGTAPSNPAVTFSTTALNVAGTLTIPIKTPQTLHANDFIAIQFPSWWPTPFSMDYTTCSIPGGLLQQRCYSIRNDQQDSHWVFFQLAGNLADGNVVRVGVNSARTVVPPANCTNKYFRVFLYYDTRLLATYDYSNLSPTMFVADPIVATVTCNPTSPIQFTSTEYIVTFNLPHDLLAKSEIRIDAEDYDQTANPNCTSTTNSLLTGNVLCYLTPVGDQYASVIGFNAIVKNSKVEIKIPLLNRAAAGTRKWRIRTYYLRGGYYYMSGDSGTLSTHTPGCTVVAAPAVVITPWATWFHQEYRTRSTQVGPLNFIYESSVTLTKNTAADYIIITIPDTFVFAKAQKVASWDMHYPFQWDFVTSGGFHTIKVWAPKTLDIMANTRYVVNITTLNGLQNVNGLTYPDQASSPYQATIRVYKSNSLVESGIAKIFVFKPNFVVYESKTYLMNANLKAAILTRFQVAANAGPYSNKLLLRFRLPTVTYQNRQMTNLFADDAGTGLSNGATINCLLTTTASTTSLPVSCIFYKGSQDLGTPATVEMYFTGSISTANVYQAVFDTFTHPAVGDDDKHVETSLEFYNPAGTWLYTGIDYDYTIVTDTTPDTVSGVAAPVWAVNTLNTLSTSFTITFTSRVALYKYQAANGIGWADYLIIEFPDGYVLSYNTNTVGILSGPGVTGVVNGKMEWASGNRWLIWRPTFDIAASSSYTLQVNNIDQAKYRPPNPVFKMYLVSNRELTRTIVYAAMTTITAPAIAASDITLVADQVASTAVIPKDKYLRYLLTFKHTTAVIPAGGVIQIKLPAIITGSQDTHCINAPTSNLKVDPASSPEITPYCFFDTTTNSYMVKNFADSPTSDTVAIQFWAKTENASPGSGSTNPLNLFIYSDSAMQYQILTATVAIPNNAALTGFDHLNFNTRQDEVLDTVRAAGNAPFEFYMTIPSTYTTTTVLTVTFPAAASVAIPAASGVYLECWIGNAEARQCTYSGNFVVQISAPHSTAASLASTFVKIQIRTRCASGSAMNGLKFSTAGNFVATVSDGTNTASIPFEVYAPNFDYLQYRVMHSNENTNNGLTFKTRPNVNVPATGSIVVKLPITTTEGLYTVWSGLYTPGATITGKCKALAGITVTSGTDLTCTYDEDGTYVMFIMTGFNAITSGTDIAFVIYDVKNPVGNADYLHAEAVVETWDASDVPLNQGVAFELFSVVKGTPTITSSTGTFTRTSAVLSATGQQYSFAVTLGVALNQFSQVTFEFSDAYFVTSGVSNCNAASTPGTYQAYGKYIAFKPSAAIATGARTFCIGGMINPATDESAIDVKIMYVNPRAFTSLLSYKTAAYTLGSLTLTAGTSSSNLNRGAGNEINLKVDTGTLVIPAGGSISFELPNTFVVHAVSVVAGFGAGCTVTIDTSVAGLVYAVVKTPVQFVKGGTVAEFNIYVTNPTAATTSTLKARAHAAYTSGSASTMALGTYSLTIGGAAAISCILSGTSFSVSPSAAVSGLNALTPASVAVSYTAPAYVGYDMIAVTSGTSGCNGMPIYVAPATTLGGTPAITLYHLTVKAPNLFNALTVTGSTPMIFSASLGKMAVDFGNHDQSDLGTGLTNGSPIPCQLDTGALYATSVEVICTLSTGNFYRSPGIDVTFVTDIPSGTAFRLVISKFYNPSVALSVEVRFRYYESVYGSRALDLVAFTKMVAITTGTVATSTTAITITPSTAQSSVTTTFTILAADSNKQALIFSPTTINNERGLPTPVGPSSSFLGAGLMVYANVATATSLSVVGNRMPTTSLASSSWIVVIVDGTGAATATRVHTGAAVALCTLSSITFTAQTKNDVTGKADYRIQWNSPCDFPKGSYISIKLAAYLSNYQVNPSDITVATPSIVLGSPTISTDGTYIYIKNYDYIQNGAADLTISVRATSGAGATNGELNVYHLNSRYIVQNTSPTTAKNTGSASLLAYRYRTWIKDVSPPIISSSGYLSLYFKLTATGFTYNSQDQIRLVAPASTFAVDTSYLRCKFTNVGVRDEAYLANSCSYDSSTSTFTVGMPNTATLSAANLYRLDIFYYADNNFGFRYPSSSGQLAFTVRHFASGTTLREEFPAALLVPRSAPTSTCFRNFASNVALKNVYMMTFSPSVTIPASGSNGFLEFRFPSTSLYDWTKLSYGPTLGATTYSGQAVTCKGFTTSPKTAAAFITRCTIEYGGAGLASRNDISRYATIKVVLASALSAGTTYEIDIYGIDNPASANILNEVQLVAGTTSPVDILQVYQDAYQLYTVTPAAATAVSANLPTFSTSTIQNSVAGYSLSLTTIPTTSLAADTDHIRLTYNTDMYTSSISATTSLESFNVNPGLSFFYNQAAKSPATSMTVSNMIAPADAETFVSSFKADLIKQKVIAVTITYGAGANTFNAVAWTSVNIPAPYNSVNTNSKSSFIINLQLSKILSKTGSIELTLTNMASVDSPCNEASSIIGKNFKCETVSATKLRISGLSRDLLVGETISINFRATTSSSTSGQVCAAAFNDYPAVPTAQVEPVQLSNCASLTYGSGNGIVWFEARTPTPIRRVQGNEIGMMTFKFDLLATTVPKLTSKIVISDTTGNFGNILTKDFTCFISNRKQMIAKSCIYYAASKTWEVFVPRSNDLTGVYTLKIISSRQYIDFAGRLEGISMPAGAVYALGLTITNSASTVIFTSPETSVNLPVRHFTTYNFNDYLIMRAASSTFNLKIRPATAIPATPNGVIKIDFIIKNRYNLDVFSSDLGTGILNGQAFGCVATGGVTATCRLYVGNAATPASILVDPAGTMLTTATYSIDLPAIFNPALNMTEVIMVVTSQSLVAGTFVNLNTEQTDVIVAQDVILTPTPAGALTWTPNLTGSSSSVSFTFTMGSGYGPVKDNINSFDRMCITVDKKTLLVLLNNQAVPAKTLSCKVGAVTLAIKIFPSIDMIELSAGVAIGAPGATVTITCTNFLNQQYVIKGGVAYSVQLWIDGTIADIFQYNTNLVSPNILTVKSVAISAITPEISSFDSYKFTIKPYNYMPVGSRFQISFSNGFTGLTNCEIVSGLNGGICQLSTTASGSFVLISMYQLWNPDVDPQIVITVDMQSPSTGGTYNFQFTSYWLAGDPAGEDKIDDDLIGSITYNSFTPFTYLQLYKMRQFTQERCPWYYDEGVITIQVQLQENLSYPHYIRLNRWAFTDYVWWERYQGAPFDTSEMICYFDQDATLFAAKSENCRNVGGSLYIMIPEELPLTNTNTYKIRIESHGQRDRGFSSSSGNWPSERYPLFVEGLFNNTGDANLIPTPIVTVPSSAPMFWYPRACYFGTKSYDSTNWHAGHNHSLEVIDSVGSNVNFYLSTRSTVRFQAALSTFNEIKESSAKDLGWTTLTNVNDTSDVACMYWHDQTTLAIPSIKPDWEVWCQVWNVQPTYADYLSRYAVMTMENYTNAQYNNYGFRYGYAGKKNHVVTPMPLPLGGTFTDGNRNTFAHLIVYSQTQYEDGSWLDAQRVVHWYHINAILPAMVDSTITSVNPAGMSFSRNPAGDLHTTWSLTFTSETTTGGTTYVYWELQDPWWHLPRNLTHGSRWCRSPTSNTADVTCNQYGVPFRWSLFRLGGIGTGSTVNVGHFGLMESPPFAFENDVYPNPESEIKWIWVYVANGQQLSRIYRKEVYSARRNPYYIFEMDDPQNPTSTLMTYRIGIWTTNVYEPYTNTVRMWIPNDFTTVGPGCKVLFGYRRTDFSKLQPADGPQCNIIQNDPSALSPVPNQYHRIEFSNMYRWSRRWLDQYECWMVFEIQLRNPATPMWTRESTLKIFNNNQIYPLVNESRWFYRIDKGADKGRTWVGQSNPTFPYLAHYFRPVRNRLTFEDRRQQAGDWAELHMRLYPKNIYPADISKVEIQIPSTYDIPNGGTNICEVGHNYHDDLTGQFCEISNSRLIQVRANKDYGLLQRCTIVRITTNNSVGNNNGFQAPATAATEGFDVNLYIGSKRIEYTSATTAPQPSMLKPGQTLNLTANVLEKVRESTLNLSFHADRPIRAGYDTDSKVTDIFKKLPQGEIWLKFNTVDKYTSGRFGFDLVLGYTAPTNPGGGVPFTVPCQAFSNLSPGPSGSLVCTVYPQTTANYYTPVLLKITNFELISQGQMRNEVHIMQLSWILDNLNLGWIEFSVYERSGDGTLTKIYDDVRTNLGGLATVSPAVTRTTLLAANPNNPVFSPNIVGARLSLQIKFSTTIPLIQYDTIEVTFPSIMELPSVSDISAVFKVVPSNVAIVPYSVAATVVVYPTISRVNFIVPRAQTIYGCTTAKPCAVTIATAGFRHLPYATPAAFTVTTRTLSKQQVVQWLDYTQVPAPVVAPYNSLLLTISSQFSGDVYVTYQFYFSPSYKYPSGSTIIATMNPTLYRQIDKSNPPAVCSTNFANITASCVITEAVITVTLNGTLTEGFAGLITAVGMKNPTFVGSTLSTDVVMSTKHPSGYLINQGNMNTLTYKSKSNVDTVIFKIDLSSYYSAVSSDYRFTLQNTNTLPPFGILNILFPQDWSANFKSSLSVSTISGGFTKDKLIYTQYVIPQPSKNLLLQIIPEFEWPSKQKLVVSLNTLINPEGLTSTLPFKIYTQYDSVTIDQSDATDPSSVITLKPYNPRIKIWKSDFTPTNEGEIATYNFIVSCENPISAGQKIQFNFPSTYTEILTVFPLQVVCQSSNFQIDTCTTGARSLTIPLLQDVAADAQVQITAYGISNPNYGVTNKVDIAILDKTDNVIEFINDAFSIDTTAGATYTPLALVSSTKNQILIKSDYQLCMSVSGNIPLGAAIVIEFPRQFDMRKDSYSCSLGSGHDSTKLPYPSTSLTCNTFKTLKKIEIYGHSSAFSYTGTSAQICYKIAELENAKDTGSSFNFNMKIYDIKAKKMTYKTSGILNYPSTLNYIRTGLRIFVDSIPSIPLGTMSNDITITLEKPVPYDVTLIPNCPGMTFIPSSIVFKFYEGQTQTFRINPDVTKAVANTYSISWTKLEDTTTDRFSEMTDTEFVVTQTPDYRAMRLTLSQNVYRASVGAESMPIYIYLSHPASTAMTVYYKTSKPFQPEVVKFTPDSVTFQPGEKVKMFTYKTAKGAVSGMIDIQLQPEFESIYYMPTPQINFEIEDVDSTPPSIQDYSLITKKMKSVNLRISCDESSKVYYICSIKGTLTPTSAELMDAAVRLQSLNRPRTAELQGYAYANITTQTSSYVYFDTYVQLANLTSSTEYVLFMMPVDLSGNMGQIKSFNFKTDGSQPAVTFKLQSSQEIDKTKLLQALSLVSGITTDKFVITFTPSFSTIPTSEPEVTSVLKSKNLEYEIMILPDVTIDGPSPYDYLKKIETEKRTLFNELPMLDSTQKISKTGKEVMNELQKFTYVPTMTEVSNFHAAFNVSVFYSGTVYGVVLPATEAKPSATQVKQGLTSVNSQVNAYYTRNNSIVVDSEKNYKVYPSGMLNFTFLYHSSNYVAYFTADRQTFGDPLLMADSQVVAVPFTTLREIFQVEDSVVELKQHALLLSLPITTFLLTAIALLAN